MQNRPQSDPEKSAAGPGQEAQEGDQGGRQARRGDRGPAASEKCVAAWPVKRGKRSDRGSVHRGLRRQSFARFASVLTVPVRRNSRLCVRIRQALVMENWGCGQRTCWESARLGVKSRTISRPPLPYGRPTPRKQEPAWSRVPRGPRSQSRDSAQLYNYMCIYVTIITYIYMLTPASNNNSNIAYCYHTHTYVCTKIYSFRAASCPVF